MSVINFTILGHPVPYLRMTQREVWLMKLSEHKVRDTHLAKWKAIKRYLDWKDKVRVIALCAKKNLKDNPKSKTYMNITIFFRNKKHGDPDNIWKGIADALFKNDKYVAGCFDFSYDKNYPRTEVEII